MKSTVLALTFLSLLANAFASDDVLVVKSKKRLTCSNDVSFKVFDSEGNLNFENSAANNRTASVRTTWSYGDVEFRQSEFTYFNDRGEIRSTGHSIVTIKKSTLANGLTSEESSSKNIQIYNHNIYGADGSGEPTKLVTRESTSKATYKLVGDTKVYVEYFIDGKATNTYVETEKEIAPGQSELKITKTTPFIEFNGNDGSYVQYEKYETTCNIETL